ncbi:MAG: UvrD-helicase domain-containing protein [Deltaproteobacteria bacterium]|nr:UvrD-helicase domain-containing protein [Deltaproteobacteria bacterium]
MLNQLNPDQRRAVTCGEGPVLILAGAGSGKTRVLTARIAYLVREKGVRSDSIMAVTFTNKAASEIRERLKKMIGPEAGRLRLGTFHSQGLRILREERRRAGLANELTVYNDDDQLTLLRQVIQELGFNDKVVVPKSMLQIINQAKNENVGPEEYRSTASGAQAFIVERTAKVYELYQKRLKEMNCVDFGDLICEPVRLLKRDGRLLAMYQERIRHMLVDEYQDTNRAQYALTSLLSGGTRNIFAVGDPDQSIYGWRGADINNILDFEKDYPDADVLKLEENYRSTKKILSSANSVIENNTKRLDKTLRTQNPDGDKVVFEECETEYDEGRAVLRWIKKLMSLDKGIAYSDVAIFYRTNAQSRVFEEAMMRDGIPYVIVGGTRFYDRAEIRDSLAYMRLMANPNDLLSLTRAVNTPSRGVGPVALEKVRSISIDRGVSLFEALKIASDNGVIRKSGVGQFIAACAGFTRDAALHSLSDRTLRLLEESGYMTMWQGDGSEEAMQRVENIFELISAIKEFEAARASADGRALQEFLDHVALISDLDGIEEKIERITMMTVHSAKGLEFKAVFITGMEEGLFPHSRSVDSVESLEEERRLCYVAMTRARKRLFLLAARSRTVWGAQGWRTRSRFLDEIPNEHIEFIEFDAGKKKGVFQAHETHYTDEGSQITGQGEAVFYDDTDADWRIGMKVSHATFGLGVIKEKTGRGMEAKLLVNFRDVGVKKLAVKYAGLEIVQ